jgi:hypothetical protein
MAVNQPYFFLAVFFLALFVPFFAAFLDFFAVAAFLAGFFDALAVFFWRACFAAGFAAARFLFRRPEIGATIIGSDTKPSAASGI